MRGPKGPPDGAAAVWAAAAELSLPDPPRIMLFWPVRLHEQDMTRRPEISLCRNYRGRLLIPLQLPGLLGLKAMRAGSGKAEAPLAVATVAAAATAGTVTSGFLGDGTLLGLETLRMELLRM